MMDEIGHDKKSFPLDDPKKVEMLKALEASLGIVSKAVEICGIARSTHYLWCQTDSTYKSAVDALSEYVLDFVEDKLHSRIHEGDTTAIIFHLKCKGKARGYGEHVKIEHSHADKTDEELEAEIARRMGKLGE